MTIRDEVSLSEQERKALLHLEARAAADDPVLAAHLRGRSWLATHLRLPALPDRLRYHLERAWVGPLFVVLGLVVTVLALSVSTLLSLLGVGVTILGLGLVAASVKKRLLKVTAPDSL